MNGMIKIRHQVKKTKNGQLSGKILEQNVPDFNWDTFKKCPGAEEWVKKTYFQAIKRIMFDICAEKNGTTFVDLQSMESVITRSLKYSKDDIDEWLECRNWLNVTFNTPRGKEKFSELILGLSQGLVPYGESMKRQLAEKVAALADINDPVADFLFSRLTLGCNDGADEL